MDCRIVLTKKHLIGYSQTVRHKILILAIVGSNPTTLVLKQCQIMAFKDVFMCCMIKVLIVLVKLSLRGKNESN